jgi:hypothetical protein
MNAKNLHDAAAMRTRMYARENSSEHSKKIKLHKAKANEIGRTLYKLNNPCIIKFIFNSTYLPAQSRSLLTDISALGAFRSLTDDP